MPHMVESLFNVILYWLHNSNILNLTASPIFIFSPSSHGLIIFYRIQVKNITSKELTTEKGCDIIKTTQMSCFLKITKEQKMKKVFIILTITVLIFGCFNLGSCTKKGEESEDPELTRAKEMLEIEFSGLQPFISMEYSLKYHSCTFYTVEKTTQNGYLISGKILFVDQFGDKYYQNYSAYIGKDSYFPEITKSEVKRLNE